MHSDYGSASFHSQVPSLKAKATLRPGVVQVWQVPLGPPTWTIDHWSLLSEDERSRAKRLVDQVHQQRFVAARAWARRIIAYSMDEQPGRIRFEQGEHGKPRVGEPPGAIEFSLSHSGDIALLALSSNAMVGVDVERHDRKVEYREIAERFFSPAENEVMKGLSHDPVLLAEAFFTCWTRKEAYVKATGYGLSRGLSHFDVTVAPGGRPRLIADRLDPTASDRWELLDVTVPSGYCGALAVEGPVEKLILHEAGDLNLG